MKKLLFILLIASVPAVAQDKQKDSTNNVMIEFCLRKSPSYKFIREGFKKGDQYWYITRNNRIKPMPKSWFVWEWKLINREVAKS